MALLLFFTQRILRLLDTANMEFVNMILHLVINCDPCVDHQIHSYLIITCISDISVTSDLKFYFMGILRVLIPIFAICIFFRVERKEKNTVISLLNMTEHGEY